MGILTDSEVCAALEGNIKNLRIRNRTHKHIASWHHLLGESRDSERRRDGGCVVCCFRGAQVSGVWGNAVSVPE